MVSLPTNHRDLGIPAVLGFHQHSPYLQTKVKRKTFYAAKNQLILCKYGKYVRNLGLSLRRDGSIAAAPCLQFCLTHKISKNLSSFTLSLSLYDQVFLETEYFSHVLTKEEELILLLESEKYQL